MLKKNLLLSCALMALSVSSALAGKGSQIQNDDERYLHYATKSTLSRFAGEIDSANKSWEKAQAAARIRDQKIELKQYQDQSDNLLDATAAFELGRIYETGNDFVAQNLHSAFANYERADKRGHPEAKAKMEEIKINMTEEQRQGYDSNRLLPELPLEVLFNIMENSTFSTLGAFAEVSKEMNNVVESDLYWRPRVQKYEIKEIPGISLKKRMGAHHHLVEAWVARIKRSGKRMYKHIGKACALGDPEAFYLKIKGMCTVSWLFPEDFTALHNLIDEQIEKGNEKVLFFKIEGLFHGRFGYKCDPAAARAVIEEQAAKGSSKAKLFKIDGLGKGRFGYTQDLDKCYDLIEEQDEAGNKEVLPYLYKGLAEGAYGFRKAEEESKNLLEDEVRDGNLDFYTKLAQCYYDGIGGYNRDRKAMLKFLEEEIKRENPSAIEYKITANFGSGPSSAGFSLLEGIPDFDGRLQKCIWINCNRF